MKLIYLLGVLLVPSSLLAESSLEKEDSSVLSLDDVLLRAFEANPKLESAKRKIQAQEATQEQTRIIPNPEIELEAKNVGGRGEFSGTDVAEYTVFVRQPIELGGKRERRSRVAAFNRDLAEWDYKGLKRAIVSEVTKTFYDVMAAQEKLALSKDLIRLSEEFLKNAKRRVKAGGASLLEAMKAKIELTRNRVAAEQAQRRLESTRRILASTWGSPEAGFASVKGSLYQLETLLPLDELLERLVGHPDWIRWQTEKKQRAAQAALAKAERTPDVGVGAGLRLNEASGDHAFVLQATIPLPFFDRNQGTRKATRYDQEKTAFDQQAAHLDLRRQLIELYEALSTTYAEAHALDTQLIAASEKAFELSREGYLQGRFGYLDVLDAERTFFEQKTLYIETLTAYHQYLAELHQLTAQGSRFIQNNPEP